MKLLTMLIALFFATSAYGAGISYEYDNAGNRVKRSLIVVDEIDNTVEDLTEARLLTILIMAT